MNVSTCLFYVKEPFLGAMDVATIFPLLWEQTRKKINFLVWEMILLHFLAKIKELEVGGATFSILYNILPKEIITTQGLGSYTTCHFHKHGWPNNTSQTSRGATSHNTSPVKGLMLCGRWHCWRTQRSRPWWSHPILYSCGCGLVGRPNRFMTFAEMRFFWLSLSTMNCSGEPFTHIYEWKICSPSSGSWGSFFWILEVAIVALGSTLIIWFPLSFLLSSSDSRSEHAYDSEAFNLANSDYLVRHSLVLWVGLLWNSYDFLVSFFDFVVVLFSCSFDGLSSITLPWLCALLFGFEDPKSNFFCLNFCSILTTYLYVVPCEEMSRNSIFS